MKNLHCPEDKITYLEQEHKLVDAELKKIRKIITTSDLDVQKLKKEKLSLKDKIQKININVDKS